MVRIDRPGWGTCYVLKQASQATPEGTAHSLFDPLEAV